MASRGGSRPGSGRKPGVPTLKTQKIAAEALEKGISPLEVMIENMRHWHQSGQATVEKLQAMLPQLNKLDDPELLHEFISLFKELGSYREKAQSCAVDAAPYMHPKLASITMKGDPNHPLELIDRTTMTARDAGEAYYSTLNIHARPTAEPVKA